MLALQKSIPFTRVSMAQPFAPMPHAAPRAPRRMGQLQVTPEIHAPINIDLGALPLTIGLFAGSAVSFLIGSQVKAARGVTTVVGVGLAGGGILNLLIGSAKAAEAAEGGVSPVTPGAVSPPLPATEERAFEQVEARILEPAEFETIDAAFFGTPRIPVRIRVSNPSGQSVTFDLNLAVEEDPSPVGSVVTHEDSLRVTLGAGQTRDVDTAVTIESWDALVDFAEVRLTLSKRRIEGGPPQLLATRFFVVE